MAGRSTVGEGPPRWQGWAAAAAGLILGVAHLVVTGGPVFTGAEPATPGSLTWVFVPVLVAVAFAAVALMLIQPRHAGKRWPLWVSGTVAVLTGLLALFGLTPLAFGAQLSSVFQGPGPYALLCAVLFGVLTLSAARARRAHRTTLPAPSPGTGPESDRTPA